MRGRAADPATYGSALVPTPPVSTAAGANKTTDSTAATAVVARLSRAPATSAFQLACMTAAQRTSTRAPADTAPEYERRPGEPPPGGGSQQPRASRPRSAPDAREPSRARTQGAMPARQVSDRGRRRASARSGHERAGPAPLLTRESRAGQGRRERCLLGR